MQDGGGFGQDAGSCSVEEGERADRTKVAVAGLMLDHGRDSTHMAQRERLCVARGARRLTRVRLRCANVWESVAQLRHG